MSTMEQRDEIARAIVTFEARRDDRGRLMVYATPPNDAGGGWEVAGLNVRFHPHEARALKLLLEQGLWQQAERRATAYIAAYTDCAAVWTQEVAIEAYIRDCVFNRGPRGAAKILQRAAGVVVDGVVGPITMAAVKRALNLRGPRKLIEALGLARVWYEDKTAGDRPNLRPGLKSRWKKAASMALQFIGKEQP